MMPLLLPVSLFQPRRLVCFCLATCRFDSMPAPHPPRGDAVWLEARSGGYQAALIAPGGGADAVTAAIVQPNTVYLERAACALQRREPSPDESLLRDLSPLGWEHINLTGDYVWRQNRPRSLGKFRPLKVPPPSLECDFTVF